MSRKKFFERHAPFLFVVAMVGMCWAIQQLLWPSPPPKQTPPSTRVVVERVDSPRPLPVNFPTPTGHSVPIAVRTGVGVYSDPISRQAAILAVQEDSHANLLPGAIRSAYAVNAPLDASYYVINNNTYIMNPAPGYETGSSAGFSTPFVIGPPTGNAAQSSGSQALRSRVIRAQLPNNRPQMPASFGRGAVAAPTPY